MTELSSKLDALKNILSDHGKILLALSGGVDSVFLLTFAYDMWRDDRIMALTASGPQFADDESEYARQLCDNLGIGHKVIKTDHVLPLIEDNPEDRCYICKKEVFSIFKSRADMIGRTLADGTNLDDMDDDRPGYRALTELGVASPLKEAGLTKAEIRRALRESAENDELIKAALMTDIWNRPALACLATRIPHGQQITEEKMAAVYKAETFLHDKGFTQVRVRHHGDIARIEVLPEEMERFFDTALMKDVSRYIKDCGFKYAALDLDGYHAGE